MAVPEQTPYSEHTGNGVTKSFALNFDCESKDHLIVLVDEIEPPIATWSLSGGNVVFTTAPISGSKITIQRNTPFSRTVDYQSYNNSFRPQSVNGDFDRLWLKLQELGVGDWLLKLYVDRLHQQQEQKIDDLKNYVDDKDDELRSYLMEEIRKQGVALDQLDEYYNYLMQRLAQIAVDKGWDASFVVDGTQTQKEINLYGGKKYDMPVGGYPLGAKVLLDDNVTEVVSTVAGNQNNPNTDMLGWKKKEIDASNVLDDSGRTQQEVNDELRASEDKFLNLKTISFESLGGVGDGNYLTGDGTDNAAAFALAQIYGENGYKIRYKRGAQYKTTVPIAVHNMWWVGDEGCTPIIFGWFSTTGKRIIGKNPASEKKNATIDGITFWRCGPNPEHGINIDNMSGFYLRGRVLGVPYCNGGAVGVSAFYTERRPSQNVHIDVYLEQTGDYGVEYGDVQHGTLRVNGKDVWREIIGFEPLMRDVFTLTSANFTDNTFTVTNHGLVTGDPIIYHSNGNPTLFGAGVYHFAIVIDANNFKIATSRNLAYKNAPATTAVSFAGTQYIVRCSIVEDITVESCILNDVDSVKPPLFGNSQGYIVATATSGGWTGNINFNPPQINSMRKTQDGLTTIGIRIDGGSGLTIKDPTVIGCDTSIRVLRGELGNWTDKNGTRITVPTICTMLPKDNVVINPVLEDFKVQGIYAQHDATKFIGGVVRSKFSGAIGINDTTSLGGTTYTDVSVDCPNGTDLVSATAVLAQDLKLLSTGKQVTSDFNNASVRTLKARAKKSGDVICEIKSTDQNRATAYMGTLEILVTSNAGTAVADIGANKALYKLQLTKAYGGSTPTLTLLSSYGLTSGAGATHPSFTFTLSGDSLIATAVASTSTTADFYFSIKSEGFINFV